MAQKISDKELIARAVSAVASQYGYKPDPMAFAREMLSADRPQLWAARIAEDDLRADGFRVTQSRKNAIWKALGGK